jgi:hypothetical protein
MTDFRGYRPAPRAKGLAAVARMIHQDWDLEDDTSLRCAIEFALQPMGEADRSVLKAEVQQALAAYPTSDDFRHYFNSLGVHNNLYEGDPRTEFEALLKRI